MEEWNEELEQKITKKQVKASEEFGKELSEFLDKWRNREDLPSYFLMSNLMFETKIEAIWDNNCYHHMLGRLTEMLNFDLKRMFYEVEEIWKDKNEGQ